MNDVIESTQIAPNPTAHTTETAIVKTGTVRLGGKEVLQYRFKGQDTVPACIPSSELEVTLETGPHGELLFDVGSVKSGVARSPLGSWHSKLANSGKLLGACAKLLGHVDRRLCFIVGVFQGNGGTEFELFVPTRKPKGITVAFDGLPEGHAFIVDITLNTMASGTEGAEASGT